MSKYLDEAGVRFLWNKTREYTNEKFSQAAPGHAGTDGKSAYEYAVAGGYAGTEEEFYALLGSGPWVPQTGGIVNGGLRVNGILTLGAGGTVFDIPYNSAAGKFNDLELKGYSISLRGKNSPSDPISVYGIATPTRPYDAANKEYVDSLFSQVAPVIVKVKLFDSSGSVYKSYNVKCYPADVGTLSYSINFYIGSTTDKVPNYIKIIPPDQYAFTGLYESSGIILEAGSSCTMDGLLKSDGAIFISGIPAEKSYETAVITGSFTLEVA